MEFTDNRVATTGIWESEEGRIVCEQHLGHYGRTLLAEKPTARRLITPLDRWHRLPEAGAKNFIEEFGYSCETCHFAKIREEKRAADTRYVIDELPIEAKPFILDGRPFTMVGFEGYISKGQSYIIALWHEDGSIVDLASINNGEVTFTYPDTLNAGTNFIGSLNRML